MNRIEITDLRIRAHHGVLPSERRIGNIFSLDITLCCDLSSAMESDMVADTINYADIISIVRREMAIPSNLLENVVGRLAAALRNTYPQIAGGTIRLAKLTPPIAGVEVASVAVSVNW